VEPEKTIMARADSTVVVETNMDKVHRVDTVAVTMVLQVMADRVWLMKVTVDVIMKEAIMKSREASATSRVVDLMVSNKVTMDQVHMARANSTRVMATLSTAELIMKDVVVTEVAGAAVAEDTVVEEMSTMAVKDMVHHNSAEEDVTAMKDGEMRLPVSKVNMVEDRMVMKENVILIATPEDTKMMTMDMDHHAVTETGNIYYNYSSTIAVVPVSTTSLFSMVRYYYYLMVQ
jgi:hypothetical protein